MKFNKIIQKIILIIFGVIGILFICFYVYLGYFFYEFGLPRPISSESRENIRIEEENRDACLESAKIWMQDTYGDAIYKAIKIENIYTYNYTDIWMPTTFLPKTVILFSTPFYKNAKLVINSKNRNEISCDMRLLETVGFRDEIYTKWLKQKLDINDDDVFFFYKEGYIIDYTEIKSLENLNEDICSRIRNVKIDDISIKNYEYSTINELMDYIISILNTILEKEPDIVGSGFRFVVCTLNEDRYFIHYKKDDNKLRWYKNLDDKMNVYTLPPSK